VLDALRADFARYPGSKITVETFVNGPPIEAPIAVRLSATTSSSQGPGRPHRGDPEGHPRRPDVNNPCAWTAPTSTSAWTRPRPPASASAPGRRGGWCVLALSGEEAARFRDDDGDDYAVKVRLPLTPGVYGDRNDLSALKSVYVPPTRAATPLSAIADPVLQSSPPASTATTGAHGHLTAFTQTGP